jgi:hypothetical protein
MSISELKDHAAEQLSSTDADLLLRIRIALSIQRRAGWHLVRFTARHGVVQLAGVVPAYYDRQLIVALVRHVAGVRGIEDELSVGDPAIRQQLDDETITLPPRNAADIGSRDPFQRLPAPLR